MTGGCASGSSSGGRYYTYMPCSLPVRQACAEGTGASGYVCNPRNDNFGAKEGIISSWDQFDIGGGEGGGAADGGCLTAYSAVSGQTLGHVDNIISGSGCSGVANTITFLATGTATGHTSGNLKVGVRRHVPAGAPTGGPQILVHLEGLGHVFTGFSGDKGEYQAPTRDAHFNVRGVSGIHTAVTSNNIKIGGPQFFTIRLCINR